MSEIKNQVNSLLSAISKRASTQGLSDGENASNSVDELLLWIHHYRAHATTKSAQELLEGARAAILESIGYISLGLGRAALAAIRTQIDLLLCFTYFCDHPKEWTKVVTSGDGFKLRSEIYFYHKEIDKKFGARLTMIDQASPTTLEEVYRVLSAHIHGQSPLTMPTANKLSDLVVGSKTTESIVTIQTQAAIALSNFLVSVHASEWTSLPDKIVTRVKATLTEKQRSQFFE